MERERVKGKSALERLGGIREGENQFEKKIEILTGKKLHDNLEELKIERQTVVK